MRRPQVKAGAGGSPWSPIFSEQAGALISQMNLTEKLTFVAGVGVNWNKENLTYVGVTGSLPRLRLPAIHEEDGPQGVGDHLVQVTQWPSAGTVTQSWDRELMFQYGQAMGLEQFEKGSNVMLGPGVNLARVPWGGR